MYSFSAYEYIFILFHFVYNDCQSMLDLNLRPQKNRDSCCWRPMQKRGKEKEIEEEKREESLNVTEPTNRILIQGDFLHTIIYLVSHFQRERKNIPWDFFSLLFLLNDIAYLLHDSHTRNSIKLFFLYLCMQVSCDLEDCDGQHHDQTERQCCHGPTMS